MKRILSIFLSVICLFCFIFHTSCKKNKVAEDNIISFDSIQVIETYHLFNDEKKPNCNLSINFVYPTKYSDEKKLDILQAIFIEKYFGKDYMNASPAEAVHEYKKNYLANYKDLENEYEEELKLRELEHDDDASFFSYYEKSSSSIVFNKGNILSVRIDYSDYTGGAHGSSSKNCYVINLLTDKLLQESDIFYDDYNDKITKIILDKITATNEVKRPKDLENIGFNVEDIIPNGNFLADDKGITYIYNQYEIAPYVMGITTVFLPYEEISVFMKKDNPLADLAGI